VFVVDGQDGQHPDPDDVLVELLACEVGYCPSPDRRPRLRDGLSRCVERAMRRSGLDGGDAPTLLSLSASSAGSGEERIEESAVDRVLDRPRSTIRVKDTVGECYSASGVLQLAAAIAHWHTERQTTKGDTPGIALITSVGRDGNVGCLVVREGAGVAAPLTAPETGTDPAPQ
jgi:3-oxoacyl-[acyl-carrier-protein] synthase II